MKRRIIKIDEEKCNGCSACAIACHEGAIGMVNGKAKLLRDDYCDGLGDCLPTCPTGAITFEEREALAYDHEAVQANMQSRKETICACPGSHAKTLSHQFTNNCVEKKQTSQLKQWPVQIKLVSTNASYFDGAKLLIAADCSAYAYVNFHNDFMKGYVTIVGCPKLDMVDYSEKLSGILRNNEIKEVRVVRMEVPCCGGIEQAAIHALKNSGKFIPWQVVTISTEGEILNG
ncbi:MAG: ATP-binding protein [Anaerorhabdus sp.]|uniref:ATP-binding protein n=1 Tax=Anaerorhabdus sp. TaxID=1872524 RepID=UPI003A888BCE